MNGDAEEPLELRRAERRRLEAERLHDEAPREGVAIFRKVDHAVLVALHLPGASDAEVDASLDELEQLLATAGGEAVARVTQRRDTPDPATFVGSGKVRELQELAASLGADAVVFDDELTPAQQRTLEERLRTKVLDRTIVILDIFAQHASSREGAAQVELAQLTYLLPRLRGWGDALSRQAGGIGTRGPGETQLEVDRRKLNRRITKLRRDLQDYTRTRRVKSAARERARVPTVALVGYTNAGKSTLMNALTDAGVHVADKLFATLDTTARQLELPDARTLVLTDTVGFVRKLPTQLVEAFKSTLEDTLRADLLLHVADAAHPEAESHVLAVDRVLAEIGAGEVPRLLVLNQIDRLSGVERVGMRRRFDGAYLVSARTGEGLDVLLRGIADHVPPQRKVVEATVPYARADLVALAHEHGEVLKREDRAEGTYLIAKVPRAVGARLAAYADVDPWAEE